MNIKQAKNEIKHTVQAYLSKDGSGEYRIPAIRQRPILLMGPPGIGKTQIMEQIARECRIGLAAYTMTHHTRQSAVGLPFIKEEEFDGKSYSVTEYTMSEMLAGIYRKQKESGIREGILFIDEINCVSETLAPTMLQFLQCKTFGNQRVPEGWLIVAAGNPPEYNKSVRDFDMVTLDRVRYLNVEADYAVWKEYAAANHLHSAVLSYLDLRPGNFYRIQADVDGMQFVTARGWEDLSSLMTVYEEMGCPVDETVVREFLHHDEVAEDAAAYFDLYRKYQDDYGIAEILSGMVRPGIYARMDAAAFDERFSVVHLLLDGLQTEFREAARAKYLTDAWYLFLKEYKSRLGSEGEPAECYGELLAEEEQKYAQERKSGFLGKEESYRREQLLKYWKKEAPQQSSLTAGETEAETADGNSTEQYFEAAKRGFTAQLKTLEDIEKKTSRTLEYAFDFMEKAFDNGQEMVIFVTELALGTESAVFLMEHTCERYMLYNRQLLAGERKAELLAELTREKHKENM